MKRLEQSLHAWREAERRVQEANGSLTPDMEQELADAKHRYQELAAHMAESVDRRGREVNEPGLVFAYVGRSQLDHDAGVVVTGWESFEALESAGGVAVPVFRGEADVRQSSPS